MCRDPAGLWRRRIEWLLIQVVIELLVLFFFLDGELDFLVHLFLGVFVQLFVLQLFVFVLVLDRKRHRERSDRPSGHRHNE